MKGDADVSHAPEVVVDRAADVQRAPSWHHHQASSDRASTVARHVLVLGDQLVTLGSKLNLEILDSPRSAFALILNIRDNRLLISDDD